MNEEDFFDINGNDFSETEEDFDGIPEVNSVYYRNNLNNETTIPRRYVLIADTSADLKLKLLEKEVDSLRKQISFFRLFNVINDVTFYWI